MGELTCRDEVLWATRAIVSAKGKEKTYLHLRK